MMTTTKTVADLTTRELDNLRAERDGHAHSNGSDSAFDGQDWKIERVTVRRDSMFRFLVEGVNLNCHDGEYGHRIHWLVPSIADRRYNLNDAVFVREGV